MIEILPDYRQDVFPRNEIWSPDLLLLVRVRLFIEFMVELVKRVEGLVRTFTQIFTSGEIWGLESLPQGVLNSKALPIPYLCGRVLDSLNKYVQFSEKLLKNKPPFNAIIGVSDIDGFGVVGEYGRLVGKCFQDEILIERNVQSSADVSQLVSDFADLISRICGA